MGTVRLYCQPKRFRCDSAYDADEAIIKLIAVLDTQELADAMNRVERGFGPRVVK
jgi:hypothetical protein